MLLPLQALGQVEMLVRVEAGSPVEAQLRTQAAAAAPDLAVAGDAQAIRPLFSEAAAFSIDRPRAFALVFPDSAAYEEALRYWAAQPGVQSVQPNHRYRLDIAPTYNDPLLDSLFHLEVIGATRAWAVTTGSPDVRIGFVDTGMMLQHPDLAPRLWHNPAEMPNGMDDDGNGFVDDLYGWDFVDRSVQVEPGDLQQRDNDPSEDNLSGGGRGHGTIVAGVLAAALNNEIGIAGVAPDARLVPLRAFGADGLGEDDDIAAALVYAADLGLDVVNLSFGDAYYSPLMHDAIRYAVARGTVVVASAGNSGGTKPHYPSDYPEVISVAWLNEEGTGIAGRGTHGVGLNLGAPGSGIYTTLLPPPDRQEPTSRDYYGPRSGSSLAAPMVSAAAALLRSLQPELSPAAIRALLTSTARDLPEPGWDRRTAAGLLQIDAALAAAFPANVTLHLPHDGGIAEDAVALKITALSPLFDQAQLYFRSESEGNTAWQPIGAPITAQVREGIGATWATAGLAEGAYLVRLSVTLKTGQQVEDHRRVFVDRTPPVVTVLRLDRALADGGWGVFSEVETDDLTSVVLRVNGRDTASDRLARQHGVFAPWPGIDGATVQVELIVTNRAGLETRLIAEREVPDLRLRPNLFEAQRLAVPHGYLLDHATDYDGDGLQEITFNQYQHGWLGDSLAIYEWAGEDFAPWQKIVSNVFPRDTGDTNGNGRLELLTQVSAATLLIEQHPEEPYFTEVAFLDSLSLGNPTGPDAMYGAKLTDLDADGKGEILAHDTRVWKVLEWNGSSYTEVARLQNPTDAQGSELGENAWQEPKALVADFDGDGWMDLVAGDADGDFVIYENTGDNTFKTAWQHQTRRYNAGSRFAQGDFDGDGTPEFWTYTSNWTGLRGDHEYEPPFGLLYLWKSTGDDTYALADSLVLYRNASRHGAFAAWDFDRDGVDELIVAHPPELWIFQRQQGRFEPMYHRPAGDSTDAVRSIVVTPGDFDGDGWGEVVFAGADEFMHHLRYVAPPVGPPPPVWAEVRYVEPGRVRLSWRAEGADSVTVFRMTPSLEPLGARQDSSFVLLMEDQTVFRLRTWQGGEASVMSAPKTVMPGPGEPFALLEIQHPAPGWVKLIFNRATGPLLQFKLGEQQPTTILPAEGGRAVLLHFDPVPAGTHVLEWPGLRDHYGLAPTQPSATITFPDQATGTLVLASWSVLDAQSARLVFSAPLDPATVVPENFRIEPEGQLLSVEIMPDDPAAVRLVLAGRAIGATGLATTIVVTGVRAADGQSLADEGNVATLSAFATDLSGVYLFPNPNRASRHAPFLMVAGLPREATVYILSLDGVRVRELQETDGNGGVQWDLRDDRGEEVPAGVYLVRVEAPGLAPVLRKAAIIR